MCVKLFFINVYNGELIAMGDTLQEAKTEYDKLLADSGNIETEDIVKSGKVISIRDLGTSIEFMISGTKDKYFVVSPSVSLDARFIKVGDEVVVKCKDYETYYYVTELNKK